MPCRCSIRGSARSMRTTIASSRCRTRARSSRRSKAAASRRSTSASAPGPFCTTCAKPAATSIGADWRIPLDEAWERIGHDRGIQGNLDPTLLLGPRERLFDGADDVLAPRRRPSRTHLQPRARHPAVDAGRARPGARALRASDHGTCLTIVIAGGGIAGLVGSVGARAARPPAPRARAGAAARRRDSHGTVDGYVIDAGPDSLLVQKPAAIDLCRELGLGDRLVPDAAAAHRLHPARRTAASRCPEASVLGLPTDGRAVPGHVALLAGPASCAWPPSWWSRPRRDGADESIGGFMRRRFGHEAVRLSRGAAARGDPRRRRRALSMRALVSAARRSRAHARRACFAAFRIAAAPPPSPDGAFVSLPGGIGELVDALVARCLPGTIRSTTSVAHGRRPGEPLHGDASTERRPHRGTRGHPRRARLGGRADGRPVDADAGDAVRRDPVRLVGHGRLAPSARSGPSSAQRLRLRRPARRAASADGRRRGCRRSGPDARRRDAC